jgi:hypothetical protein
MKTFYEAKVDVGKHAAILNRKNLHCFKIIKSFGEMFFCFFCRKTTFCVWDTVTFRLNRKKVLFKTIELNYNENVKGKENYLNWKIWQRALGEKFLIK